MPTIIGALIGATAAIFVNIFYENHKRAQERAFKILETRLEKLYSPLAATFGVEIPLGPKKIITLMENNLYLGSPKIKKIYIRILNCFGTDHKGEWGIKIGQGTLFNTTAEELKKQVNKEIEELLEKYYKDYTKYYG